MALRVVTSHCKFSVDGSSACGDIIYSNCKVTSHEGSSKFMSWSSLWYVTFLISFVIISIVIVEI